MGWWNQALAPLNAKQHDIGKFRAQFYFLVWKAESHCWDLLVDTACKRSPVFRGSGHGSVRKVISGARPELGDES